jgi:VanZ like family
VLETIRGIPHLLDFWIVLTGLAMPQAALAAVRIGSPARRVAVLALPASLALIVAATLSPTGLGLGVIGACGHGLTSTGALTTVQGLLNVLLFVPAAVALTVATGRPAFVTGAGAGLSVAVEAVQSLAPGLGRSCQLHDVIANSLGAIAGVSLVLSFDALHRITRSVTAVSSDRWRSAVQQLGQSSDQVTVAIESARRDQFAGRPREREILVG